MVYPKAQPTPMSLMLEAPRLVASMTDRLRVRNSAVPTADWVSPYWVKAFFGGRVRATERGCKRGHAAEMTERS